MKKKLLVNSSKIFEHISKDCDTVCKIIEKYLKKKSDYS